MTGTTEEKKSIFARTYDWLAQKATAFKNAVISAFASIKNWFKSLSLFKTETPPCCAGKAAGEEDAAATTTGSAPAPQQPTTASAAVIAPAGADGIGAATASATAGGVTATATAPTTLSTDALAAHDAKQSQGEVSASKGSKASSVTSKAS